MDQMNFKNLTPGQSNPGNGNSDQNKLHIFINKIKYDEKDGVKNIMTGRELAALVSIDPAVAEITRIHPGEERIGTDQAMTIHMADQYEIIRTNVQAGFYGRK